MNRIETIPLCATLSNLADMLTMLRGLTLLRGQRSKVKVTTDMYGNKLVNKIETKSLFALHQIWHNVSHSESIGPMDFGGHRSKVKATMDIYRSKLVNRIETKPLCATFILVDTLTMVRG